VVGVFDEESDAYLQAKPCLAEPYHGIYILRFYAITSQPFFLSAVPKMWSTTAEPGK
jgi:hypothetical protein